MNMRKRDRGEPIASARGLQNRCCRYVAHRFTNTAALPEKLRPSCVRSAQPNTKLGRHVRNRYLVRNPNELRQSHHLLDVLHHEVHLSRDVLPSGGDGDSHEVSYSHVEAAVGLVRLLGEVEIETILLPRRGKEHAQKREGDTQRGNVRKYSGKTQKMFQSK